MPSSTASCTQRTASPSTARPCANHQKNPPSVASLTPTTPSEPLKPSMGAAVRDHRNAVRDRSESLSAINRNTCPQSPESAVCLSALLRMGQQSPFYIFTAFVFAYGVGTLHMSRDFILSAVLVASCISLITTPLFGHISDRIGRKK